MFNKVVLIGRMVRDPELRYTSTNIAVVSFTIAVNRTFASQNQENNADFINCTAWRKQAENLSKYVSKGALIAVEGRLQTRDYLDEKINARRYVTEVICDSIVFLESKSQTSQNIADQEAKTTIDDTSIDIIEDDLPF